MCGFAAIAVATLWYSERITLFVVKCLTHLVNSSDFIIFATLLIHEAKDNSFIFMILTIITLLITIAFFIWGRVRSDIVAMAHSWCSQLQVF